MTDFLSIIFNFLKINKLKLIDYSYGMEGSLIKTLDYELQPCSAFLRAFLGSESPFWR